MPSPVSFSGLLIKEVHITVHERVEAAVNTAFMGEERHLMTDQVDQAEPVYLTMSELRTLCGALLLTIQRYQLSEAELRKLSYCDYDKEVGELERLLETLILEQKRRDAYWATNDQSRLSL